MPTILVFLCYLVAVVLFAAAAVTSPVPGRVADGRLRAVALGLAFAWAPALWAAAEAL